MPRTRALVAGLAVAAVAMLAPAAPASAHDELIASDPAPDQQMSKAPEAVTLTYSAEILHMGAAVVVADDTGTDQVAGTPRIDGDTVTVDLEADMPEAAYVIRWRVVSSDGHPVSGTVPFTVGDGGAGGAAEAGAAEAGAKASSSAQVQPAPSEDEAPWRAVVVGASGAAVAVAVLVLVQILRRRSHADGTDASGPDPSEPA